jgi:hypothetical protein
LIFALILVYSHTDSPRLRYVLDFLSGFYAVPFRLTSESSDARVFYSDDAHDDVLTIRPSGLLSVQGITPIDPRCAEHAGGFPVLFPDNGPLGFDLFSAVFYLLSRYEEWLPHDKDAWGRYAHHQSTAFRNGFLSRPLVHEWLAFFSERLFGEKLLPPFRFQPTYDIDMAWSYRHKGLLRNAGGLLRHIGTPLFRERLAVLRGRRPDPFDSFDALDTWHQRFDLQPIYFIHSGLKRGRYDKNIPLRRPAMQQLAAALAGRYSIGLHPSWRSGDDAHLVRKEKEALEKATGKSITISRQHYIRFAMPQTFRELLAAGIRDDYSMGYGSINGFRASVALPFYWYDLEREEQMELRMHPFCFMDANAFFEQKQDVKATRRELAHYRDVLRAWGGDLITVWHNNLLGSAPQFDGWAMLYEAFLDSVRGGSQPG